MVTEELRRELTRIVGDEGVVSDPHLRAVYESDGYTLERAVPDLVVLPADPDALARVVRVIHEAGVFLVPRGAGTSLAGGCLAGSGGVVVATTRLRRIETIDTVNGHALVQAGVANLALSHAAAPLAFAPDPSSQQVATIGGNIANNSGGPHTLKHGVTVNHVLAVEWVAPTGERRWLGCRSPARGGLDTVGVMVGSEGTFGIVTRAWVRLVTPPPGVRTFTAAFAGVEEASRAVSSIIASGVIPAAVEMMDALILGALREAFGMQFPEGTEALLLVEVDGLEAGLDDEAAQVEAACRDAGAFEIRKAEDEKQRELLWRARKQAFGALGRLSRNFCTQDGVVPRSRLPEILNAIGGIAERFDLRVANVFHAGDGNLHPILLYDERDATQVERVLRASTEILERCLEMGGSLTGEHGVGIEKVALMEKAFSPESLEVMNRLREAFDPDRRSNPGKAVPAGGGCADPPGWGNKARALARVHPGRQAPQ